MLALEKSRSLGTLELGRRDDEGVFVVCVEEHLAPRVRMKRPVVMYRYYVERLTGDAKNKPDKVQSERALISRHAAVLLGFKG
jgi:hypothetical protein